MQKENGALIVKCEIVVILSFGDEPMPLPYVY